MQGSIYSTVGAMPPPTAQQLRVIRDVFSVPSVSWIEGFTALGEICFEIEPPWL